MKKKIIFEFENSLINKDNAKKTSEKLFSYMKYLQKVYEEKEYDKKECSIILPNEVESLNSSKKLAKTLSSPTLILIIGIGGSNLGSMAVCDAILGLNHNILKKPQIVYADTVDPKSIESILNICKLHAKFEEGRIITCLISKSGKTLETIANFEVINSKLSKIAKNKVETVIISDENSGIEKIAKKNGFYTLSIEKNVGGRFSLFSNVGLFIFELLKINSKKLLEGANDAVKLSIKEKDIYKNPSIFMSSFFYLNKNFGKNNHVEFIFSNDLKSQGQWYRQLMGESLGKIKIVENKKINDGITPIISIGTTDLHSMGQLYLAGPRNKTYRFVQIDDFGQNQYIKNSEFVKNLAPILKNENTENIMKSICNGTMNTYKQIKIPFVSVRIPKLDEYNLGYYMQMQMMEIIYTAKLMDINAFDQPEVESYKNNSIKLLEKI